MNRFPLAGAGGRKQKGLKRIFFSRRTLSIWITSIVLTAAAGTRPEPEVGIPERPCWHWLPGSVCRYILRPAESAANPSYSPGALVFPFGNCTDVSAFTSAKGKLSMRPSLRRIYTLVACNGDIFVIAFLGKSGESPRHHPVVDSRSSLPHPPANKVFGLP